MHGSFEAILQDSHVKVNPQAETKARRCQVREELGLVEGVSFVLLVCFVVAALRLEGFEPPTYGSVGHCSIQLSYRRFRPWPALAV